MTTDELQQRLLYELPRSSLGAGVRCAVCGLFYRVAAGSYLPRCCDRGFTLEYHTKECLEAATDRECRCSDALQAPDTE